MAAVESTPPSGFVLRCLEMLQGHVPPGARALDVAMGAGRHVAVLAQAGFRVFGVDRHYDRARRARASLRVQGSPARIWVADLETISLPDAFFHVAVCTRYLQRSLWSELGRTVTPGGFVVYQTFTTKQRRCDWGPRSSEHLLAPDELRTVFAGWDVWASEEHDSPAAEAGVLARRPTPA